MIKVDMHVHTSCSHDSLISADELLETCDYHGIDCVAVTDHDTIECALKLYEQEPSRIIVGEEIHTTRGEITGLFLKEHIPPKLSPMETIQRIKAQGGLVYVPHPFDAMRSSVLDRKVLEEVWESIDILETFNSRSVFVWSNWRASDFATEKDILPGVGSDAHSDYEVGRAYVLMEPFDSPDDFLLKLAKAEVKTKKTPVMFNLVVKIYKLIKGIG